MTVGDDRDGAHEPEGFGETGEPQIARHRFATVTQRSERVLAEYRLAFAIAKAPCGKGEDAHATRSGVATASFQA